MEKYKEPQIYVINNSVISEKLQEKYVVAEGNLGVVKRIRYESYENSRYINLEYNLIENLHEYKVVIIDMQNKYYGEIYAENETPNGKRSMFKIDFPMQEFDPSPIVMNEIPQRMKKESIRVIFSGIDYTENYEIVEVIRQNQFGYSQNHTENIYKTIGAETVNKAGKKVSPKGDVIAQIIAKYVIGYDVVFELPTMWDASQQKSVFDSNFIPLILNQDNEVISYYGYNELYGYELLLPICRDKERLIDELFSKVLPEIFPNIFPESREFQWINNEEFKPKEVLACEKQRRELKDRYEKQLKEIHIQEVKIYKKYQFLNDLLTQTGEGLVKAVCKYFKWLGFSNVQEIDGSEDILREDIQIMDKETIFIIEVKGIGGTSTDAECAQISKHRRKREKENEDKEVVPIYIVNHQRYVQPQLRDNPPFNKNQIDYAYNDERGLLTTWQLYQQFKLIEDGIFTKEETRQAMQQIGLITLVPKDFYSIGTVTEYFKKSKACILNLDNVEIKRGICVWAKKGGLWKKGEICSIQVNDNDVDTAKNGG